MPLRPPSLAELARDQADPIEPVPQSVTSESAGTAVQAHWIRELFKLAKSFAVQAPHLSAIHSHLLTDLTNIARISSQKLGSNAHDDLALVIRDAAPPRKTIVKKGQPFITYVNDDEVAGGKIIEYNVFNISTITHIPPDKVAELEQALLEFAKRHANLLSSR